MSTRMPPGTGGLGRSAASPGANLHALAGWPAQVVVIVVALLGSILTQPGVSAPLVLDLPPAPEGYGSRVAVLAAIATGQLKLIQPDEALPEGVTEERDVVYGRVGQRELKLDLALPAIKRSPTEKIAGLIFVHGGDWSGGERSIYHYYTRRFAKSGYAAATISYRLSGEAPFPAAVQDAKCAVRWMRANADRYGIDPDRIAILGGSAGGHLALMVAYSDSPDLEGDGGHAASSSRVAAVVDFYGPVDLTTEEARAAGAVQKFLGGTFADRQADYVRASPITHLDAHDPPTLIIHGALDEIVSIRQSEQLVERLEALQVPYAFQRLEGWPHTLDAAERVNEYCQHAMRSFLARELRAAGERSD